MKRICTFKLQKPVEIEETQIQKNDKGEEIKVLVKVKKDEEHTYFLAKPGRVLTDQADLFYNSEFWKLIKSGIMPLNQLRKRLNDDGGVLSQEQNLEYNKLYDELFQKQAMHRSINSKTEKSDEDKKESEKIMNEIVEIMSTLQSFESKTGSELYQNTAENLARNKLCLFWTLVLSYEDVGGKEAPVFGPGEFEKKLAKYDEMEAREDAFEYQVIQRCLLTASLWSMGKAESQEDFDLLFKVSENSNLIEAAQTLGIKEEEKPLGEVTKDTTEFNKSLEDKTVKILV